MAKRHSHVLVKVWPFKEKHLLGVASHLLSPRCFFHLVFDHPLGSMPSGHCRDAGGYAIDLTANLSTHTHSQRERESQRCKKHDMSARNTVDGRNPAPVDSDPII